jgi:cytochrome c biogenesis protein CcmG/thiol:disulfide interchange protein DsbE
MNRLALFLPLALFVGLSLVLLFGLDKDPTDLPSALVGEAFPEFMLPTLQDETKLVSQQDLQGQVLLVNVWATWCFACRIEHPNLNELAEQGVVIVGLNYKDQRNAAKLWLLERGNPYSFNIFDDQGSLGIDLGVYGAPETYLVDADGVIRYRRVGVVDKRVWDSEFSALYQELTGKTPTIGGVR